MPASVGLFLSPYPVAVDARQIAVGSGLVLEVGRAVGGGIGRIEGGSA
jgi:hypothetical protein